MVSEALTNVARHAKASSVVITAARDPDRLFVTVEDDGAGQATVVEGGGLSGLTDRVDALGGHLTVDSPVGGPTRLRVELPCGS